MASPPAMTNIHVAKLDMSISALKSEMAAVPKNANTQPKRAKTQALEISCFHWYSCFTISSPVAGQEFARLSISFGSQSSWARSVPSISTPHLAAT